jgi:hypothetical protein
VRAGPGDRVAQLDDDERVAEHGRGARGGLRVLQVAGALLPEQHLVAGVGEVGADVPVAAPAGELVGEEHLGLGSLGARHGDLRVRGQLVVQVGGAAALGTDDEQVPRHSGTRVVTW